MKEYLLHGALGVVGGVITSLLGGWSIALTALLVCIVFDIITGLGVALKGKSTKSISGYLSSQAMWLGAFKKGGVFAIIIVCNQIDLLLGTELIRNIAILFYISCELVSLTENCKVIGIPVPKALIRVIDTLKDKAGEESENNVRK